MCPTKYTRVEKDYKINVSPLLTILPVYLTVYLSSEKLRLFISSPIDQQTKLTYCNSTKAPPSDVHTYGVNSCLFAGKREGEACRKVSVLHPHVVQEVTNTICYMIKQLTTDREEKDFGKKCQVCVENIACTGLLCTVIFTCHQS